MFEIPDIFLGWKVDAGSEPMYAEKIRVPPPGQDAERMRTGQTAREPDKPHANGARVTFIHRTYLSGGVRS